MKLLTAAAMKELDRRVIEELGLPGTVLMENAGMRVVEVILKMRPAPEKICVVAGPGNNGGDGLVIARQLQRAGREVSLIVFARPEKYPREAAENYRYLRNTGFPLQHIMEEKDLDWLCRELCSADLVVDALLGVGLQRPLEGLAAGIVRAVNESGVPVLAVDIPSGICADTGALLGEAVKARWTVTLAYPKRGLLLFPGAELAGEVIVGDLHFPRELAAAEKTEVITGKKVRRLLPERPLDGHKGSMGRVLLVAGSPGLSGAAVLAGEAALRGGAGLVYVGTAASGQPLLEGKLREVISFPLPEESPGVLGPRAAGAILEQERLARVLAVGPGIPPVPATAALIQILLEKCSLPLVLDAGALRALAGDPTVLRRAQQPPVITPHPGELSHMLGVTVEEIQGSRLETARSCAEAWNCILVLKGARTVVAAPDGRLQVNPTGGPNLATAGTGDLLTGLIAALIAQGMPSWEAALSGVFLHGLAGDLLPSGRGYMAGDFLNQFGAAFRFLQEPQTPDWGPFNLGLRPA